MNSIRNRLLMGLGIAAAFSAVALFFFVIDKYNLVDSGLLTSSFAWYEIQEHVVVPVAMFAVLFSIGAFFVVRNIEKILQRTTAEINEAAATLQSYKGDVDKLPSELRPLVSAFNELTGELERHSMRQQAFAADAAHELKTPLAVIALEIDKLPGEDSRRLKQQIMSLSDMIDQLLLLARSNSKQAGVAGPLIDPQRIGRAVVEQLAPSAISSGVSLSFENKGSIPFHGLEEAVSAAIRTLAVNAIRVTPKGGNVIVRSGPGPTISVLDGGPSLDAETLEKLKARGVRGDRTKTGDAGLGLAIADRIAEAHGGELLTCMPDAPGLKVVFPNRLEARVGGPAI